MDKEVVQWSCEKPVNRKVEPPCLPTTQKDLIPGYDFKTSTKIGLQHLQPPRDYFEVKPLYDDKVKDIKDYKQSQRHYRTTSQAHDGRKEIVDPINQANRISGTKCLFIKEYEEHLKQREVEKVSNPQSIYKIDYKPHRVNPEIAGTVVDHTPDIYCKIKGIAKNEQPKVDLASPTLVSFLDNYLSTNKTDYVYITPERREFFITKKEKFAVKKEKDASRIFEEGLFRFRHLNRTVPKFVDRVPNKGIITETKSEYKNLWGDVYKKPAPVYDSTIQIRMTKGDIVKIPAMYQTEYNHYGSKISPNQYV